MIEFDAVASGSDFRHLSRDEELALIGAKLALASSQMARLRQRKENRLLLLAKCRRMGNANESPWITFRHLIKAGRVKLIRRRGKSPLLVTVAPKHRHWVA